MKLIDLVENHPVGTLYKGYRYFVFKSEGTTKTHKVAFGRPYASSRKTSTTKFRILDANDHKTVFNAQTGESSSDWHKNQYWNYTGGEAEAKAAIDKMPKK